MVRDPCSCTQERDAQERDAQERAAMTDTARAGTAAPHVVYARMLADRVHDPSKWMLDRARMRVPQSSGGTPMRGMLLGLVELGERAIVAMHREQSCTLNDLRDALDYVLDEPAGVALAHEFGHRVERARIHQQIGYRDEHEAGRHETAGYRRGRFMRGRRYRDCPVCMHETYEAVRAEMPELCEIGAERLAYMLVELV
jgi:hypothetical protein